MLSFFTKKAVDHMTSNEALLHQKLDPKVDLLTNNRVKKTLPEKFRNKTEASFITAFVAATIATVTCYPLDTIRRQMQMRSTPYNTVLDAFSGNLKWCCQVFTKEALLVIYRERYVIF